MKYIEFVTEKTPVSDLRQLLATRTINVLYRAGYRTVGDILNLTEEDVAKCRNAGNQTRRDAMRFIREYNECHGESQKEKLISADKLIEYCKECADMSQKLADKALENIGKGESEQFALGACAFYSTEAKMYRYDIPDVIRAYMDRGADNA